MRKLLLAACLLAPPLAAVAADACDALLRRQRVTIIVPFGPGGGYDTSARLLAAGLQEQLGLRVSVSNISGAQGLIGVRAVASASPQALTLGVFDLRDLMAARLADPSVPGSGEFVPLGGFGQTAGVWAGRAANDLLRAGRTVAFGASTGVVPRVQLPAMLLGLQTRMVRGYAGSSDRWLAVQRGDVDATDGSLDNLQRLIAATPGTRVQLLMATTPRADLPGVPHLAGPGGLVDQRTRAIDAATRRERMQLAELAAMLSTTQRAVVASRHMQPQLLQCAEQAVEKVLFSPALREAALARKLPVEPERGVVVRAQVHTTDAAVRANEALLKRLAAGA